MTEDDITEMGRRISKLVDGVALCQRAAVVNPFRTGSRKHRIVEAFACLAASRSWVTAREVVQHIALISPAGQTEDEGYVARVLRQTFEADLLRSTAFALISTPSSTTTSAPSGAGSSGASGSAARAK